MELGSGGMGVVYGAVDTRLNRAVAIKCLRPARGAGNREEHEIRFEREAQALARVGHPNVVQIFEVGVFEGLPYMVMEYIEGQTLDAWLAREARSIEQILEVFCAAGRGLAAAHARGLVHRDFKPKNLMIGDDGRVRVVDFGLAQVVGEWPRVPEAGACLDLDSSLLEVDHSLEESLTISGVAMGTPAYMAPEQFSGDDTDPRTDQFAFCVSLWEALYGARPFRARSVPRLSRKVRAGEIDELVDRWLLPRWLRAALVRGLSPDPGARWPSMDALIEQLERPVRARLAGLGSTLSGIAAAAAMFVCGLVAAPGSAGVGLTSDTATLAQHQRADAGQVGHALGRARDLQVEVQKVQGVAEARATPKQRRRAQPAPASKPREAKRHRVERRSSRVASEGAGERANIESSRIDASAPSREAGPEQALPEELPPAVPLHGSIEAAGAALGMGERTPAAAPPVLDVVAAPPDEQRAPRPEDYQDF